MRLNAILLFVLGAGSLAAVQHNGSVRAADQFLPGVTVTARQGGAKVVAYTDENGRYSLDLTPGNWQIDLEMFGFATFHGEIAVGSEPVWRDWTIEMPRAGAKPVEAPKPATAAVPGQRRQFPAGGGRGGFGGRGQGAANSAAAGGRGGRGAPGTPVAQNSAFQNVTVTATAEGEQALAAAAHDDPPPETDGGDDSFVVNGSMSGGLAAAADEQVRRDRAAGGRGGPGGPGGPGGGEGGVPGMFGANSQVAFNGTGLDPLGMGAFGAAGAANGFGADNGGGFGGGPGGGGPGGGGPGGGGGGGGRGGGGGGGGGGRGGAAGGRAAGGRGNQAAGRRGPFNGQFAAFGNRRRTQPAYTGSFFLNAANSAFNAAPYSLNGQKTIKPNYAREGFGVNVGGPLRIPKLITNDKYFISINYQGNRNRNPFHQDAALPTLEQRGGDFSSTAVRGVPVTIFDPATGAPFPGNVIPTTRINPAAAGLMKYFPAPLYAGIVQNYQYAAASRNVSDSLGVRFNLPLSKKDRLNFNEQVNRNNGDSPTLFGFRDNSTGYGISAGVGWSHSFKPRFNQNLNINFSRNRNEAAPFFAYKSNVAAELGIFGTSQDPISWGPPNLSFTNFAGLNDGSASVGRNQTTSVTEGITYVRKRHNLTFGIGYRRMQQNSLSYANSRGAFSFSGLLTSGFDAKGQPIAGTGFDFADFLLGLPQTSSLRLGNSNNYFRGWSFNWYVQDDWRIRPNLSINVGLRYEYFSPYTELRGHIANLDVASGFNGVSVVTPGGSGSYSGAFPAGLINGDPNNYSPRFGFSWRPSPKKSRVIRGGYSVFFSGASYSQFASRMAAQPPFATTASLATSTDNPLTIQHGFPTAPSSTITNSYAIDRNYKPAYAQTWTFALQQTFPRQFLIELEYLGTKGTGLDISFQPNRAAPGSPLTADQRLKIGNATGFTYETSQGNSIFHAGQLRVTRRFARGLSANALYTFSKSIDNASTFGGGGGVIAQDPNNLSAERGLSTFDTRHRLNAGYTLSSPVGVHGMWRNGGWKTKALTGWTLSGNFTAISGTPLTARVSGNLSNTGGTAAFGTGRAQATGDDINAGGFAYFNLKAFTLPPAGQYGNAGRNTIPGLFQLGLNASLNRAWRLGDTRRQLQLRIAANNALNHVTITNIGTTVNAATFGLPTAASQTRTATLTLRFNF
jgi:trimeric autotransporter adhesin